MSLWYVTWQLVDRIFALFAHSTVSASVLFDACKTLNSSLTLSWYQRMQIYVVYYLVIRCWYRQSYPSFHNVLRGGMCQWHHTMTPPICNTQAASRYVYHGPWLQYEPSVETHMKTVTLTFITARRYASAVYAMVVCLCVCVSVCVSVCPLQVGVLLKWLNIGKRKQRHTIAQGL